MVNLNANAAALHQSGIQAVRQGRVAEGRALIERAVAADRTSVQYLVDLAQVQIMSHDQMGAIESFRRALKLDPGIVPAWLNLGLLLMHTDRVDEAAGCFEKAAKLNPKLIDAHNGLGVVRQRQRRLGDAAAAFERAAKLDPNNPELCSNLGSVLYESGQPEKALPYLKKATELAPKHAPLHAHLGLVMHELHGPEAGLPHFDEALRLSPDDARTLATKGSALLELGRAEEAAEIFDHDALLVTRKFEAAPGYPDMAAFNAALAEHSVNHPTFIVEPKGRTTRGGGQTDQLFGPETGPFAVLEDLIRGAIDEYFADTARQTHRYMPQRTGRGALDAWATVLDSGGYQDPHNHPSGILSGVYYVQLPDTGDAGAIEFGRPAPPFSPKSEPDVVLIRPEPGMVVLFPSFFWHRTIPFPGTGRRISIAFDLIMNR
ncbi:MAG: tetratricopeptide repeat protein [Pseudomonadota bacterium]